MKTEEIRTIHWADFSKSYLIDHPFHSPVLADPTFTFPEYSPDNKWHLFAHSIWGIHHFISKDGVKWIDRGIIVANAMRPYLFFEDDQYYLLYEKYKTLSLALSWIKGRRWNSVIAVSKSKDLFHWTDPLTLISPELEWHKYQSNSSVSNPCLIKYGHTYYLYYSASLVFIPDCGFNEPDSIGLATSQSIDGPYKVLSKPVISVSQNDRWCNLSCGSIKVLVCDDGFVGFENGIYWNEKEMHSGSAIITVKSSDGINWQKLINQPILQPSEGWRRSHIYACDVRYRLSEKKWYLYYNARNGWKVLEGRERIGLLIGE